MNLPSREEVLKLLENHLTNHRELLAIARAYADGKLVASMSEQELEKTISDIVNKGIMDEKDTAEIIKDQVQVLLGKIPKPEAKEVECSLCGGIGIINKEKLCSCKKGREIANLKWGTGKTGGKT